MKKLFSLFLALFASVIAIHASTKVDGIWYHFYPDGTAYVTCRGSDWYDYDNEYSGSVTIPETVTYNGTTYSVIYISYEAFMGCSSLKSVTIGNNVGGIGEGAFRDCTSLTSVTIGSGVTSIGIYAFDGCDKLYEVYCYTPEPPAAYKSSFSRYNAFLYVPCDSKKAFMLDDVFSNFNNIECISSEDIENVQSDEVQSTKVIKDGQVLILRNGKTYTMQGQEVK